MTTILDEILAERVRQHQLHGDQSHLPMGTGTPEDHHLLASARQGYEWAVEYDYLAFGHILTEEWAEFMAATTDEELRAEAVQVAAVCVQIIEAIDQRAGT